MNQHIRKYEHEISTYGLYATWEKILQNDTTDYASYMLNNVSEMYEYGLAYADKKSKKIIRQILYASRRWTLYGAAASYFYA